MSALTDVLETIAPTVASALLGPLGGVAITGLGKIFGLDQPTIKSITQVVTDSKLTPDQMAEIKKLELQFQNDEAERGFKYAELEYKDRDSARNLAIQTHAVTPAILTWLIVVSVVGLEGYVMLDGIPEKVADLVAGRILGTLDAALVVVLQFWFGGNSGTARTKELLAQAQLPPGKP